MFSHNKLESRARIIRASNVIIANNRAVQAQAGHGVARIVGAHVVIVAVHWHIGASAKQEIRMNINNNSGDKRNTYFPVVLHESTVQLFPSSHVFNVCTHCPPRHESCTQNMSSTIKS